MAAARKITKAPKAAPRECMPGPRKCFWSAKNYSRFATKLPSNKVAYAVLYSLLRLQGKFVLDFGCYRGESSRSLLDMNAKRVMGVDKYPENILAARAAYKGTRGLEFLHVGAEEKIPGKIPFDTAMMVFVHPTISSQKELAAAFRKISRRLKQNGSFGMLGLHPNSLSPEYNFRYYKHRLMGNQIYEDGSPFQNELLLPGRKPLRFGDFCWREETIVGLLKQAGFRADDIIGVGDKMIKRRLKPIFNTARDFVSREEGITWLDEWTAPLYQIFYAVKK